MANQQFRPVKFKTAKTVCATCSRHMEPGELFRWVEQGHNRLMECKPCAENPPAQAEPAKPKRSRSKTTGVDPQVMDTLAKVIDSVNQQNSFIGNALKTVDGSISAINTTTQALQAQVQSLQQQRPVQVVVNGVPKAEPIEGTHPAFKQALATLAAGENLYMLGPQAVGKSTLVRHLAQAMEARVFKLAPGTPDTPRSAYFGFDGPNGYSGSTLADAISYDGWRIIYMEELDNTAAPLQVALHDILDCAREKRGAVIEFTANERREIVEPDKLMFVATGNTAGLGATRNHAGRRPMDSATVSRFAFLEVNPVVDLELTIARSFAPDHGDAAIRWARYIQELRSVCAKELPQLVPCARAIQRGSRLIQTGEFNVKTRKASYELAQIAVFRGLDEPTAQRLHKSAWAASDPKGQGGDE